ncbi:hypothetical protein BK784_26965 [Bacillus thuringiensis serovar medellin]|uniref:Uncharacterized protein n=1 Tax=Bacillus thuringiensis subsp. medellin TaxID=79672 RepID=A0A9X6N3R8_BACTV|nr:hypothetical protein [Bacillus thuringiensis]MEC5308921.1 hypothetical protein [Bacillus thuringiensis]OUB89288.1 hypothetical protein BK784_26965 [Bacillus thuringiensis serovar medellin]
MKNNQENQVTAPAVTEAVGKTILELTEWIQSVCRESSADELKRLSDIVMATSELYKAFKI